MADTADRAARLTGQLLAFARRQALRPEVLDVGRRIEALAGILQTALGHQIALINDTDCEICFAEVDPSQLETAIINMAVNARDAMAGEGVLTILVRPVAGLPARRGHAGAEGRFVAISVADTGVGIESDKLDQIFEPFFTTKAIGKGTGLGLSQVYGFAKQSGGDVGVTSKLGEGATFTMFLPRVEQVETAVLLEHVEEGQLIGEGHVLVVEDNEQVGAFSTQMLEEVGFTTTWVSSGEAALKKLEEAPNIFSVVFSDVVMPGMNGIQLAREVRTRMPRLPIVLTSGYSQVLAQEGSHGFELLQKPYSVEELAKALYRAIHRGAMLLPSYKG